MIRCGDPCWKEMNLLSPLVASKEYGVLLAVEYSIDDGVCKQFGDALFYDEDRDRLFVVECKLVKHFGSHCEKTRTVKACVQADTCAARIRSYLNHLCAFDPALSMFAQTIVVPVVLTNYQKMELTDVQCRC